MHSNPAAGIFALAFNGQMHGLAVGGDLLTPAASPDALATTADGGLTWELVDDAPNQYRSSVAWITGRDAVAVGPTGSDVSSVCRTRILPQINTGMAGKVAGTGQVGAGLVTPPMECFVAAIDGLAAIVPR